MKLITTIVAKNKKISPDEFLTKEGVWLKEEDIIKGMKEGEEFEVEIITTKKLTTAGHQIKTVGDETEINNLDNLSVFKHDI